MIVSVASGKGGTGKTTIATNLAMSLTENTPVQVLDCDVEEPNAHLFLRPVLTETETVTIPVPIIDEAKCTCCGMCSRACAFNAIAMLGDRILTFPELCHGCGGCSLVCPQGAISEEARRVGVVEVGSAGNVSFVHGKLDIGQALAPPIVRAVKRRIMTGKPVIIDAPPGTSCPVVATVRDTDFCILVTEPTPFGLHDLTLAVDMVRDLGIPFGVVINRSSKHDVIIEQYTDREGIPILLKIPFSREFAAAYARGSLLTEESPALKDAFRKMWGQIAEMVRE